MRQLVILIGLLLATGLAAGCPETGSDSAEGGPSEAARASGEKPAAPVGGDGGVAQRSDGAIVPAPRDGSEGEKPVDPAAEAMFQAARKYDVDKVRALLDSGVDPDIMTGTEITALHWAMWSPTTELAELLIARGADVNAGDSNGATPLVWAAQNNAENSRSIELINLLIEAGADLEAVNVENRTPLHKTVIIDLPDNVRLLCDLGANVFAVDDNGQMPLHHAAARNLPDNIEILLAHGAKVDVVDNHGATPLHLAAMFGAVDAIQLLLEAGADPKAYDHDGLTPRDYTTKGDYKEAAALLKKHGG